MITLRISNKRRFFSILGLLIAILICLPMLYLTAFPLADEAICTNKIARKIKTEPNMSAVRTYVLESLEPGMNRNEVNYVLAQVSEPKLLKQLPYVSNNSPAVDVIYLKMCWHPFNNLTMDMVYNQDNELVSAYIEGDY